MTLPCRVTPEKDEEAGIALSEEATRIARRLGNKHLFPPRCPLVHLVGDENAARGAAAPSVAKDTLTRDSRRRWKLQREAYLRNVESRTLPRAYLLSRAIQNAK